MRILLVNKFHYHKGGGEEYLFDLRSILQRHGHEVATFSMKHPQNIPSPQSEYFVEKVDYDQPGTWLTKSLHALRILHSFQASQRMAALVKNVPLDLAHVQNIYHQISPSILPVLTRNKVPVIMTLHDLKLVCPNYKMRTNGEICERCKPHKFYQAVLNRCVKDSYVASAVCATEAYGHWMTGMYDRHVYKYTTPSQFYYRKFIEWGIPEEKLVCIPHFLPVQDYKPVYEEQGYGVYVGRLSEEKGLLTLVKAMARIPHCLLFIIGDGPLRQPIQDMIAEEKISNVTLKGPKWGKELAELMQGAKFGVVPSEWYENNPNSLRVSYAFGKPVIGADIGGIPEMIEEGQTGLLFQPFSAQDLAEKIQFLFNNASACIRMGKNARKKVEEEGSPELHYRRMVDVYKEAIGTKVTGARD